MTSVPVKGANGRWLDACSPARARQLMREEKARMRESAQGQKFLQLLSSESDAPKVKSGGRS